MATRLQIAKPDILRHFDELPQKVLRLGDIQRILKEQREFWRLAQSTTSGDPYGQNTHRAVVTPLTPPLGRSTEEVRPASRDIGRVP